MGAFQGVDVDLWQHASISIAAAAGLYFVSHDAAAATAFAVAGTLVDCDHLIDYWREAGLNLDLKRFWGHFEGGHPVHLWLLGHAWEWVLLGAAAWALGRGPAWILAGLAGLLLHLILDQAVNGFEPLGYSILYRAWVGFEAHRILKAPHASPRA
jgi:hypothetical protein